jgi:hypothetical protein
LLSSNPALTLLVVVFIAGALLFALGTFMIRREAQAQTPIAEADPVLDIETRIDHIERLAMVAQPWCIAELRALLSDEDERVRNAAEDALLMIAARG